MKVKRSFITFRRHSPDNQAMLDISNEEMARRVRFALDGAARGAQKKIADEREISVQAVSNWRRSGTVDKAHLPALSRHTGRRIEYFLDPTVGDDASENSSQLLELDADILASSIVSLKESAERSELQLDFFHAAEALAYVYGQRVKHPKKMTKAEYVVFDDEIRKKLSKGTGNEEVGRREAISGTEGVSKPAAKTEKARSSGSDGER